MRKETKSNLIAALFVLIGCSFAAMLLFQNYTPNQSSNPFSGNKPVIASVISMPQYVASISSMAYQMSILNPNLYYQYSSVPNSGLPNQIAVSSSYNQTVMNNYLVSIDVKQDSGFRAWWCGVNENITSTKDPLYSIFAANSSDGISWANVQSVLNQTDPAPDNLNITVEACNPVVVKANGIYYMYYQGVIVDVTNQNANASIYVATSSDGVRWTKNPTDSAPQPILNPVPNEVLASLIPVSALYLNNTFYLYYYNTSTGQGNATYLATSSDGINFNVQNSGQPVFQGPVSSKTDVKYLPSLGVFFMSYATSSQCSIHWTYSWDGIDWQPSNDSNIIQSGPNCAGFADMLGNPDGTAENQSLEYFVTLNTSCTGLTSCGTVDASNLGIYPSNITQSFASTDFKCLSISSGYDCVLNYTNTMNESAAVTFLFRDANGTVLGNSVPVAAQGVNQVASIFNCNSPGDYYASWKAFRISDTDLSTPVAWSKSYESQYMSC